MCLEGFFGGGSSPRRTYAPAPAPAPAPNNASVQPVERKQRKKRSAMYNRRSTILTGGVNNEQIAQKKTLLGS